MSFAKNSKSKLLTLEHSKQAPSHAHVKTTTVRCTHPIVIGRTRREKAIDVLG